MICTTLWMPKENGRRVVYRPGNTIRDDHPKRAWLLKSGFAAVEVADPVEEAEPEAREPDGHDAVEPEPPEVEDNTSARPRNSAPLEDWRKYATSKGIDHKGMTKAELQAATR